MPTPSHHIVLALYADHTAIISLFRKPTLLVSYLESYLSDLQRWLSERRIAIIVSNSFAIIYARAERHFIQPRTVILFGEPIQWVDTARYLGVTLDKRLIWSPHIDQVRKRTVQRMVLLVSLLNGRSDLPGTVSCYTSSSSAPCWTMHALSGGQLLCNHIRRLQVLLPKCLHLVTSALVT
jgi:hypothetical protein